MPKQTCEELAKRLAALKVSDADRDRLHDDIGRSDASQLSSEVARTRASRRR
jgi:hypothetical protein